MIPALTVRQRKRRRPRALDPTPLEAGLPGTLVAHHGVAVEVQLDSGERRTVKVRRRSGHVVGDQVEVIGERLRRNERATQLRRRDAMGRTHVVAANLDVLGLVLAPLPPSPTGFIDRALVCAEAAGITPFLVVNKADMPETAELLERIRTTWLDGPGSIELPVFVLSAARASEDPGGHELDELIDYFAAPTRAGHPRRGAFVGTSGVGKSSLVNALLPTVDLAVGEINHFSGLGRHTTTTATLHELPKGGELIDTPGFRDFGLVDIDAPTLRAFFPGFATLLRAGACRFSDCRHKAEPDCAIKAAVHDGRLATDRWERYLALLASLPDPSTPVRP